MGSAALRGVLRHPRLELGAVKVYSEAKEGRDAGALVGEADTGVVATRDVDAVLASRPDCILYCPMPWDTHEICRLLEAGVHVITPCPYWFPFVQNPEVAAQLSEACRAGGVNFHASGCNPGGIAERFPLTFTGWCNRIDRITMTECGDCRTYSSEGVMREQSWNEPIDMMIATGLGCEVVEYEAQHDFILANQDIGTAVGIVKKDTIALNHYRHVGRTREGMEIVQEQIWYLDDRHQTRLQRKMDIPRDSGWRIAIEGDVNLHVDVDFPPGLSQDERVAQGLSTTGFHLVNAVAAVCEAPEPGITTYLDLPMITGAMGTHELAR